MDYKVVVTAEAEEDLNQFIQYLLFAKKNKQAAKNVLDDFEDTIKKLKYVASSLNVCDNPRLQSLGYRRINFQQHRYFMLYRIENDVVYVDDIFHESIQFIKIDIGKNWTGTGALSVTLFRCLEVMFHVEVASLQ